MATLKQSTFRNDVSNLSQLSQNGILKDPQALLPVWLLDPTGIFPPKSPTSDQEITCIHTLPDLDYVAAGRVNGGIDVWAVIVGETPQQIPIPTPKIGVEAVTQPAPFHTDTVTCIYASDGWLVSAGEDFKVNIIEVTRVEKKKANNSSTYLELQFSLHATLEHVFDGQRVWPTAIAIEESEVTEPKKKVLTFWTGGSDGAIRRFGVFKQPPEGSEKIVLEHTLKEHSAAISSMCVGSKQFYSADVSGWLKVWTKDLDANITEFKHTEVVSSVCISADHVFTACGDGRIRMFEKTFGPGWKPIKFLTEKSVTELEPMAHTGLITCMKLFGNRLFSASYDSTIKVWHAENGQPIQTLDRRENSSWAIKAFAVGLDRLYMAENDTVVSWIPSPGDLCIKKKRIHNYTVKSMATNEHFLITTGDTHIKMWDKFTMEEFPPKPKQPAVGEEHQEFVTPRHDKLIKCLARDGKILYSGSDDCHIKSWLIPSKVVQEGEEPQGLRYLETLTGHKHPVTCIVVDESRVYAGSAFEAHGTHHSNNVILIWNKVAVPPKFVKTPQGPVAEVIRTPIAKIDLSFEGRVFSVDSMAIFQNYLYCGVTQTVPNTQYIRILNKLDAKEFKSVPLHPAEAAKLKYGPQQPALQQQRSDLTLRRSASSAPPSPKPKSETRTSFFDQVVSSVKAPFMGMSNSSSMKSYGTLDEQHPEVQDHDDDDNNNNNNHDQNTNHNIIQNNAGGSQHPSQVFQALPNPNLIRDEVHIKDWETNKHKGIIRGIHIEKGRMITVSDDGSLRLWTQDQPDEHGFRHWRLDGTPLSNRKPASDSDVPDRLKSSQQLGRQQETYDPNQGFHALHVDDFRIYAASENQILIFHKEHRQLLQRLEGHKSVVWSLIASDGIVYSGSYDRTVRSWKPERYDIQGIPFFQHCAAPGTHIELFCEDDGSEPTQGLEAYANRKSRKNWKNVTDLTGRNALTVCAATGNLENAIKLLEMDPDYDLSTVNSCGESSLFYALREQQWDFIENIHEYLKKRDVLAGKEVQALRMPDPASVRFIAGRAVAGDEAFFKRLFANYMRYDLRPVLMEAIKNDQLWLIQLIPQGYNSYKALHAACFFGKPDCVSALLEKKAIRINELDSLTPKLTNITAVDICHLGAEFSELNFDSHTDDWPADLQPKHFMVGVPWQNWQRKEWIPSSYWDEYEFRLIQKRNECFQRFAKVEEVSKRPDWTHIGNDGKRPYDRALELHGFAVEKMKTPKLEISDRSEIEQSKALFDLTARAVVYYQNKVPEIQSLRARYANFEFAKQIALFLLYLILLTSAGLMGSVNVDSDTYYLTDAMNNAVFGDDFAAIGSSADVWNWIDNTLIPSFSGDPPFMLEYNLVIGSVQLRQLKVKKDSCSVRSLYNDDIPDCYAREFSSSAEDKEDFGPNKMYKYSHDGSTYWASDDIWYPSGGFIEDLPTNDADAALNMTQSLQDNGWITPGTRLLLITWTVYNANLRGSFASATAEINFNPSGQVSASSDITTLGPYVYDTDVGGPTGMKYVLELIVFMFIIYEFMWTEIHEIRAAIDEARVQIDTVIANITERNAILKVNNPLPPNRPVFYGLRAYLSQVWNYYEWFIIVLSLILFGLRIQAIAEWNSIDLHPEATEYSNFQRIATITAYEQDLFAVFLVLNWLRLLKFFRLQPFTGPLTQSIMDTLTATTVIVFVAIIFYVLLVFSLAYYIAFGPDLESYKGFSTTIMTMFQALFGNWDYDSLKDSNKVFGPVLFLMFFVFVSLVLMNLLIGVLGQAYEEAQGLNEKRWNRFITNLMILNLNERCKPVTVTKDGWFWQEFSFDKLIAHFAPPGLEPPGQVAAGEGDSIEQSIYYNDDQLDDIVVTEVEQAIEEEEMEEEEEKKKEKRKAKKAEEAF